MLDEWRPLMCPYDITFAKAMFYFSLFLPTTLPPEKQDRGFKYVLNRDIKFPDKRCVNVHFCLNHFI